MRRLTSFLLALGVSTSLMGAPVQAQDWHGHGGGHGGGEDWHWHGDIHSFHVNDYDHWRGGHWFHGPHDGRDGWWWTVGGFWYFYPQPVYPYPDPYTPPDVVVIAGPATAMAPAYVYYCGNPAGYYPYVGQCFGPWQKMIPTAEVAAPVVAPPAPQFAPAPAPVAPANLTERQLDDRQLNAFAVEFQKINLQSSTAPSKLKKLEARVDDFRETLFNRSYNAMDILKDTEGLKNRIHNRRLSLEQPAPQPVEAQ